MLFNSLNFIAFLFLALLCFYTAPAKRRKIVLLALSYVFYSFWSWKFCLLLIATTAIDFFCALKITETKSKIYLYLSLLTNMLILFSLKYFNFFLGALSESGLSFDYAGARSYFEFILPVGVSFYTFQKISYIVDVYKGKARACKDATSFALFIAYFPQLVAGPIEKVNHLLPQLQNLRPPDQKFIRAGVYLIIVGYVKKVLLGDTIAPYVDKGFTHYSVLSSFDVLLTTFLFSFQIYFDFSGYSNIARGISYLFGVELKINFRQPYFSKNITDFWRRWHVSLSDWLKEYIYVPLGGNRKGKVRTAVNIVITMLLGGLWHGANVTFLLWSAIHAFLLIVNKSLALDRHAYIKRNIIFNVAGILVTYILVTISWTFFRAETINKSFAIISHMGFEFSINSNYLLVTLCGLIAMLAIDLPIVLKKDEFIFLRLPQVIKYSLSIVMLASILYCLTTSGTLKPFIYFQF